MKKALASTCTAILLALALSSFIAPDPTEVPESGNGDRNPTVSFLAGICTTAPFFILLGAGELKR